MVEGWLPTEVGRGASLFEEGADLHDWVVEQAFTIERIAGELEGLGYSVQPVLVPAAACGAPHRRDRIFILASAPDADRRNDVRSAGEDEGKGKGQRLQEWDEVREPGISDQIRPARPGIVTDADGDRRTPRGARGESNRERSGHDGEPEKRGESTERNNGLPALLRTSSDAKHDGLQYGLERGGEGGLLEEESAGGERRLSNEIQLAPAKGARDASTDPRGRDGEGERKAERIEPGREGSHGPRCKRNASDAFREGLEREDKPGASEGGERLRIRGNFARYNLEDLLPGNRWRNFPTVSPIHRGNDGLPFRMDRASISFGKWRTESLKAYGNAIVPQVMYRIFEAIEKVSK